MSMGFFDTVATDDVTLNGLEKWTCYLYENLGWMTLAYESNNNDKVSSYLISIKKLKLSIEKRQSIAIAEDTKIDLEILLNKVKNLYNVATKLFDKNHIRKSICDKCALPIHNNNNNTSEPDEENQLNQLNQLRGGSKLNKSVKSVKSIKSIKSSKPSGATLSVLKLSKNDNLEKLKKLSKKSSKKGSKVYSKNELKKTSKKTSKKELKVKDEPLIKKLSKKSSKKSLKKSSNDSKLIFKKM
jgi:hypothetical protein